MDKAFGQDFDEDSSVDCGRNVEPYSDDDSNVIEVIDFKFSTDDVDENKIVSECTKDEFSIHTLHNNDESNDDISNETEGKEVSNANVSTNDDENHRLNKMDVMCDTVTATNLCSMKNALNNSKFRGISVVTQSQHDQNGMYCRVLFLFMTQIIF